MMKSKFIFLMLTYLFPVSIMAQETFYVMQSGSDNNGDGSFNNPYKTIQGALIQIPETLDMDYEIVISSAEAPLIITSMVIITKKGTPENQLTIRGHECHTLIQIDHGVNEGIRLLHSSYVTIRNLHFQDCMPRGIHMRDGCNHIKVTDNKFTDTRVMPQSKTGVIVFLGTETHPVEYCEVSYNHFSNLRITEKTKHHHVIYQSNYSNFNKSIGNEIYNTLGYGIHGYYCVYHDNDWKHNIILHSPAGNNSTTPMIISEKDSECNGSPWIYNNIAYWNYTWQSLNLEAVHIDPQQIGSNFKINNIKYERYGPLKPFDPYWKSLELSTDFISASGDMDGDEDDEINILTYNQGGKVELRQLYSYQDHHAFINSAFNPNTSDKWWEGVYDLSTIDKRVVTADINGDGKKELLAFRDGGSGPQGNITAIDCWFQPTATSDYQRITLWTGTSYTATQIEGRVVSGDFDNNGMDDLAAMYDYGGGLSRIHVWLSTSNGLIQQGSSGWWSSGLGSYTANNVKGRMVAGDFDGDGFDDIATMYDYGSGQSRIHVFKSNGSQFISQGSQGWWSSTSFTANGVTGLLVAGDFGGDSKTDLAAMYRYSSGDIRLFQWISNGVNFTGFAATNFEEYDATNLPYRLHAGTFSSRWPKQGVTAIQTYDQCDKHRTHVWRGYDNEFLRINNELGYPWLDYDYFESRVESGNEQFDGFKKADEASIEGLNASNGVKIYPNPATDRVFLEFDRTFETFDVVLKGSQGSIIFEHLKVADPNFSIDCSTLSSGFYVVEVRIANQIFIEKLIIR